MIANPNGFEIGNVAFPVSTAAKEYFSSLGAPLDKSSIQMLYVHGCEPRALRSPTRIISCEPVLCFKRRFRYTVAPPLLTPSSFCLFTSALSPTFLSVSFSLNRDYVDPSAGPTGFSNMGGTGMSPINGLFNGRNILTFQALSPARHHFLQSLSRIFREDPPPRELEPGVLLRETTS